MFLQKIFQYVVLYTVFYRRFKRFFKYFFLTLILPLILFLILTYLVDKFAVTVKRFAFAQYLLIPPLVDVIHLHYQFQR